VPVVYISIGNSDDKLTQTEWSRYHRAWRAAVAKHAARTHGAWTSPSTAPWQNACLCVEICPGQEAALREELTALRRLFRQDSIAWAEAPTTEFL